MLETTQFPLQCKIPKDLSSSFIVQVMEGPAPSDTNQNYNLKDAEYSMVSQIPHHATLPPNISWVQQRLYNPHLMIVSKNQKWL